MVSARVKSEEESQQQERFIEVFYGCLSFYEEMHTARVKTAIKEMFRLLTG